MFKTAIIAATLATADASRLKSRMTNKVAGFSAEYNEGAAVEAKSYNNVQQAYSYSGSYTSDYDGSSGYYYYAVAPATKSHYSNGYYSPSYGSSSGWGESTDVTQADGSTSSEGTYNYYSSPPKSYSYTATDASSATGTK